MNSNLISNIITKLVLAFSKKHADKIDAAKEKSLESLIDHHVKYTGFIKGFMIFGILLFTGFGILSLHEKMYVVTVIFALFAIATILETFYMFSFSVHYDGPVIKIHSIFGSKEFLRKNIRELSIDDKGGIRARFTSGKIHIDEYCTGRQGFYNYLENAFEENADIINAEKATKTEKGFWCRNSWAEILIMVFCFVFFAGLGIWLIPPEIQAGTLSLFTAATFLILIIFPIVWIFNSIHNWIKVFPQKRILHCYRFIFKEEIPFDAILKMQEQEKNWLVFYQNKKGKTRKIKIYLTYTNAEYFINLLIKEVFEKQ